MCGIAGIWLRDEAESSHSSLLERAVDKLKRRGPDAQAVKAMKRALLGHTRLSIIDTSSRSDQPMQDATGRYTLVFNGELYNYRSLRDSLVTTYGATFRTEGDTEVLLQGLICEGAAFLHRINGFFAFGFYDAALHSLLLARDRFGIKPLYYALTDHGLCFGSTLQSVIELTGFRQTNTRALAAYLQLSYVPAPMSMVEGIEKMLPGQLATMHSDGFVPERWYHVKTTITGSNGDQKTDFKDLLRQSVKDRLVADVPLGTFLSGGLDSSVISLLANEEKPGTAAFSITFPDHPYIDEGGYAKTIARHIGAEHHIIPVSGTMLDSKIHEVLHSLDEPLADSSAILVNILSEYTRGQVKVALSGDGADELMGGYNKHRALLRSLRSDWINATLLRTEPALRLLPESRHHHLLDRLRKMKRYSRGLKLEFSERYYDWACFTSEAQVRQIALPNALNFSLHPEVSGLLAGLNPSDFNSVLLADLSLVLPNDMLTKVDTMSMYHGLEVRVPFLDHRLVELVRSMDSSQKISSHGGKLLLRKSFEHQFPTGIFDRKKKGFEAPLGHWLTTVLQPVMDQLLDRKLLLAQGLFSPEAVARLRRKAMSRSQGDAPHTLWALIVFQHWYVRQHGM